MSIFSNTPATNCGLMTAKYHGDRTPEIEAACKFAPFHMAIVDTNATGATERSYGVGGGEHGQDAAFGLCLDIYY